MLRMRIAFSDFLSGLVLNDFLEWVFQEVRFCVAGIFLFLNPRWVLLPSETFLDDISDFSRRTGWSAVFSSCRVAAPQACETSRLDPPPRFPISACFERFCPEDILRFWISRTRSGSVFLDRRDYGEFIAVDDGLLLIFSQESHRGC